MRYVIDFHVYYSEGCYENIKHLKLFYVLIFVSNSYQMICLHTVYFYFVCVNISFYDRVCVKLYMYIDIYNKGKLYIYLRKYNFCIIFKDSESL